MKPDALVVSMLTQSAIGYRIAFSSEKLNCYFLSYFVRVMVLPRVNLFWIGVRFELIRICQG